MKVKVKFNKTVFDDVDMDESGTGADFKALLYSISGVPPERQKLMTKGGWSKTGFMGTLKDEFNLSDSKIKEGQLITLMGTADEIKAPLVPVKFLEDMTEEEKAEKGAVIPAGLINMGNTCYMNSTMQCIRAMPDLREALGGITGSAAAGHTHGGIGPAFCATIRNTFDQLDKASSESGLQPMHLVMDLHRFFPQFAQRSNRGTLMQHDAQELLGEITKVMREGLNSTPSSKFDDYMTVTFDETITCKESTAEEVRKNTYINDLLQCNIQGGPNSEVKIEHMKDGVLLGLQSDVEMQSESLGRNAIWEKRSRISKLPKYICVHFMRFFWKQTPDSRDHTGVKCKIRKAVSFPAVFDTYDMCNDSLQTVLKANRIEKSKAMDAEMEAKRAKLSDSQDENKDSGATTVTEPDKASTTENGGDSTMEVDEEEEALRQAMALSMDGDAVDNNTTSSSSASDTNTNTNDAAKIDKSAIFSKLLPDNFCGEYELMGVVTHKGADADSGHYIAWVRQEEGSQYWWKYDDDKVSEVTWEQIVALKGGGDWATAYLNFYKAKTS